MRHPVLLSLLALLLLSAAAPLSSDLLPTKLRVTVRDDLGNTVGGAKVTLYATEEDYSNSENVLQTLITDEKGRATFDDLEPKVYYMDIEKGDQNNFGMGNKTEALEKGRLNKVTVVIS